MGLAWFDTSEVDALAASLVSEFCQHVPAAEVGTEVRGGKGRLHDATDILLRRVEKFAASRKLNIYKRARLANALKWKLRDAGYGIDIVDALVLDVAKRTYLPKQTTGS